MAVKKLASNEWLIPRESIPSYLLHRLRRGRVGIYEDAEKIASVEVLEGMEPRLLGFLSTLSEDHRRRLSIKTETEVEVESIYAREAWSLMRNEVPAELRDDVRRMLDAVVMADHIKGLRRKLSRAKLVELSIPEDVGRPLSEMLSELRQLYERMMNDPECRDCEANPH